MNASGWLQRTRLYWPGLQSMLPKPWSPFAQACNILSVFLIMFLSACEDKIVFPLQNWNLLSSSFSATHIHYKSSVFSTILILGASWPCYHHPCAEAAFISFGWKLDEPTNACSQTLRDRRLRLSGMSTGPNYTTTTQGPFTPSLWNAKAPVRPRHTRTRTVEDDVASLNTVSQRRGGEHKTDLDDGGWWKQLRSSDEPARDDDNDADARNSHTTAGFSETDFLLYTKRHILTRKDLMLICRWSVGNTSYFYYQSIQRNNLEINYLSGIRWYRQ